MALLVYYSTLQAILFIISDSYGHIDYNQNICTTSSSIMFLLHSISLLNLHKVCTGRLHANIIGPQHESRQRFMFTKEVVKATVVYLTIKIYVYRGFLSQLEGQIYCCFVLRPLSRLLSLYALYLPLSSSYSSMRRKHSNGEGEEKRKWENRSKQAQMRKKLKNTCRKKW